MSLSVPQICYCIVAVCEKGNKHEIDPVIVNSIISNLVSELVCAVNSLTDD